MNKRQKKKMAKKMREKARNPVGVGTAVKMLCDAVGIFTKILCDAVGIFTKILCDAVGIFTKILCDAMGAFNDAMAAYAGETKTFTEILTRQRATGRRKKRIAVSGRRR